MSDVLIEVVGMHKEQRQHYHIYERVKRIAGAIEAQLFSPLSNPAFCTDAVLDSINIVCTSHHMSQTSDSMRIDDVEYTNDSRVDRNRHNPLNSNKKSSLLSNQDYLVKDQHYPYENDKSMKLLSSCPLIQTGNTMSIDSDALLKTVSKRKNVLKTASKLKNDEPINLKSKLAPSESKKGLKAQQQSRRIIFPLCSSNAQAMKKTRKIKKIQPNKISSDGLTNLSQSSKQFDIPRIKNLRRSQSETSLKKARLSDENIGLMKTPKVDICHQNQFLIDKKQISVIPKFHTINTTRIGTHIHRFAYFESMQLNRKRESDARLSKPLEEKPFIFDAHSLSIPPYSIATGIKHDRLHTNSEASNNKKMQRLTKTKRKLSRREDYANDIVKALQQIYPPRNIHFPSNMPHLFHPRLVYPSSPVKNGLFDQIKESYTETKTDAGSISFTVSQPLKKEGGETPVPSTLKGCLKEKDVRRCSSILSHSKLRKSPSTLPQCKNTSPCVSPSGNMQIMLNGESRQLETMPDAIIFGTSPAPTSSFLDRVLNRSRSDSCIESVTSNVSVTRSLAPTSEVNMVDVVNEEINTKENNNIFPTEKNEQIKPNSVKPAINLSDTCPEQTEDKQNIITRHSSHEEISKKKIRFDPRVWVYEFSRSSDEQIWFTAQELESFKIEAMARVRQWNNSNRQLELISSGTGRVVNLSTSKNISSCSNTRRALYTNPALSIENEIGENDNTSLKLPHLALNDPKVCVHDTLREEIQSVLLIDPHDIILNLFAKSIQSMWPHVSITTVKTAEGAWEKISTRTEKPKQNGKNSCRTHKFDVIIAEERLGSFYHQDVSNDVNILKKEERLPQRGSAIFKKIKSDVKTLFSSTYHRYPLLIGVSAFLQQDKRNFEESGADLIWGKPPPPMNSMLSSQILTLVMEKRRLKK